MPTYQYQCKACGHELEEFQSIKEDPLTLCPKCNTQNLARVMGTGVGLIFRGTGFYLTDYKNKKSSGGPEKKETTGTSEKKETTGTSEKKETKGSSEKKETKGSSEKKEGT
jgi:putative FmdB family regulatory protein